MSGLNNSNNDALLYICEKQQHKCDIAQCFPNSCARGLLSVSKITTDPYSLAHDKYPKLKMYISEIILDNYEYTPVACVAMHCMIWA